MKPKIQTETKEETVLREYRHLRTIIKEERRKVEHFEAKIKEARAKIDAKLEVLKANEARFKDLRKQAAKILTEMLDEDAG